MFPLKDNIPLARFPLVTVALVAINVIAYLLEIRHGGSFFGGPTEQRGGALRGDPLRAHPPRRALLPGLGAHARRRPERRRLSACRRAGLSVATGVLPAQPATWETVFTSMFLHGSFLHIFGNMLFLAIFGPTVEDATGRGRFLVFYLLGGLVALGAQVLVSPDSTAPTLGASGAIAAVLGGYILLYPRARVLTLVFIIFFVTIVEVPAVALLGFWFVLQLAFGAAGLAGPLGGGEGVAYFAHVGGFVFGLLAIRLFAAARKPQPPPCRCTDGDDGLAGHAPRMTRLLVLGPGAHVHRRFAFLTFAAVVEEGFSVASALSVFILVLLAVGIVGALRNPPR